MIDVTCPRCGSVHHSEESHIGKHLRCARCGSHVPILRADRAEVRQSPPSVAATSRKASPASTTPPIRRLIQRMYPFAIVSVVVVVGVISLVILRHPTVAEHATASLSGVVEPARPPQSTKNTNKWEIVDATPS